MILSVVIDLVVQRHHVLFSLLIGSFQPITALETHISVGPFLISHLLQLAIEYWLCGRLVRLACMPNSLKSSNSFLQLWRTVRFWVHITSKSKLGNYYYIIQKVYRREYQNIILYITDSCCWIILSKRNTFSYRNYV